MITKLINFLIIKTQLLTKNQILIIMLINFLT